MLRLSSVVIAALALIGSGVPSASAAVAPKEGGGPYFGKASFEKRIMFGLNVSEDASSVEPVLSMFARKPQCKGTDVAWFKGLDAGKHLPIVDGRFSGSGVSSSAVNGYTARWSITGEFVTPNKAEGQIKVQATFRREGKTIRCSQVRGTFAVRGYA